MKSDIRRQELLQILLSADRPVSGGELAQLLGVSRQIIVSDITVLKAAGYDIIPTHYGYVIHSTPLKEMVFKVKHDTSQTEDELLTIVELGGSVVDVFVRHKIYGTIEAKLNIFTKNHIEQFIDRIRSGKSTELMNITGGYHYHTVRADSKEVLDKIYAALKEKGYLIEE